MDRPVVGCSEILHFGIFVPVLGQCFHTSLGSECSAVEDTRKFATSDASDLAELLIKGHFVVESRVCTEAFDQLSPCRQLT